MKKNTMPKSFIVFVLIDVAAGLVALLSLVYGIAALFVPFGLLFGLMTYIITLTQKPEAKARREERAKQQEKINYHNFYFECGDKGLLDGLYDIHRAEAMKIASKYGYDKSLSFDDYLKQAVLYAQPEYLAAQRKPFIDFYTECETLNLTDFSSRSKKEKAKLIAKKYGYIEGRDFDAYLAKVEETMTHVRKENAASELEELQKSEKAEYEKLIKYAEFSGRNKRIAMLTDIQADYQAKADHIHKAEELMMSIGAGLQQKESDWATHGGIAAGIAGGAAALAVAADIQQKNATIRANNQAIMGYAVSTAASIGSQAIEYTRQAEATGKEIASAQLKLVDEEPANEVFKRLTVKTLEVDISQTGAFSISASVSLKNEQKTLIFMDDVKGVVDGTIIADFWQFGKKVGSALLVLPLYGIGERSTIFGIGLCEANEKAPYEIKYSAYNLWIMEQ